MNASTDQNSYPAKKGQRSGRWLGLFMFLGGGVIAYLCIISPLLAASRHEEDVTILPLKSVVLAPALLIIGLILLFIGNERAGQLFGTREKKSVLGIVICIVTVGIGIFLYEWLKSRLKSYGYGI